MKHISSSSSNVLQLLWGELQIGMENAQKCNVFCFGLQATKNFIEVVNRLRRRRSAGLLSWTTAVKFLAARKFDVARALVLYEQHEATRQREGLTNFDPTIDPLKSELDTGKFTILVSHITSPE